MKPNGNEVRDTTKDGYELRRLLFRARHAAELLAVRLRYFDDAASAELLAVAEDAKRELGPLLGRTSNTLVSWRSVHAGRGHRDA